MKRTWMAVGLLVLGVKGWGMEMVSLPWDENVRVGVACRAVWVVSKAGGVVEEERELKMEMAACPGGEEVPFPLEGYWWKEHLLQEMEVPEGWYFFVPKEEVSVVKVVVEDSTGALRGARLEDMSGEVWGEWESGDGFRVEGEVVVTRRIKAPFRLRPRREEEEVAQVVALPQRVDRGMVVWGKVGFQPNRGWNHSPNHGCPYLLDYIGSEGDPYSLEGKGIQPAVGNSVGCAYREDTENDGGLPLDLPSARPQGDLLKGGVVVRDDVQERWGPGKTWPVPLGPEVYKELRGFYEGVRKGYEDESRALQSLTWPPYSKGTGHWRIGIVGEVMGIVILPMKVDKDVKVELPGVIEALVGGGKQEAKGERNWYEVLLGFLLPRVKVMKELFLTGEGIGVGDVWVVKVKQFGSALVPLTNLTQEVTIRLVEHQTRNPVAAYVVISYQPFTTPSPPLPPAGYGGIWVPAEGIKRPLGKGYRWTIEVPQEDPQWQGKLTFDVPYPDPGVVEVVLYRKQQP